MADFEWTTAEATTGGAGLPLKVKAGNRCMDCGFTGHPWQFDFDHREPSGKEFRISSYKYGVDRLRQEVEKCDLVCANCHRNRTHRQRCPGCIDCNAKETS